MLQHDKRALAEREWDAESRGCGQIPAPSITTSEPRPLSNFASSFPYGTLVRPQAYSQSLLTILK